MPVGVIINALSVVIGGILGTVAGHKLSPKFKADLTMIFGLCSMGMGISTIANMENMPAVIFPLTTPAMILVMPLSYIWTNYIMLLV